MKGCRVTALDARPTAIADPARRAADEELRITAREADLRTMELKDQLDCVVAIGLLMFFPREVVQAGLARIRDLVRSRGLTAVNVLIEGPPFMEVFRPVRLLPISRKRAA